MKEWILHLFLALIGAIGILIGLYNPTGASRYREYLQKLEFTDEQIDYTLSKCDEVRDCDHFIKWFGAINRHEVGGTFIDGKTPYLAGRLKKGMYGKDFKTQLDGRVNTYNKYRYKNNTIDDWLIRSKYCVSDTHGGGEGCPNWRNNVGQIVGETQFSLSSKKKIEPKDKSHLYIEAVRTENYKKRLQKELIRTEPIRIKRRKKCIDAGVCKG